MDDVLSGGLLRDRAYLVEGDPGTGKTTLAFHFLLEGIKNGERCLYITLSESREELLSNAAAHKFDLSGIEIFELPSDDQFHKDSQNTFFHSSEIELSNTNAAILEILERIKPQRAVFDSLSEMKLLSKDSARFRKQILSIKRYVTSQGCTVMMLDDLTATLGGKEVQSIVHGVIRLEQLSPEYGVDRRRLRIQKLRGMKYREGYHDYVIDHGGMEVFPRLVASDHQTKKMGDVLPSGIVELDELLCGGIHRGSSTLIMGPAGTGKSSLALQFACSAALRGEKSELFIFDESLESLLVRANGIGMPVADLIEKGLIRVTQINPAEITPGQLTSTLRHAVEVDGVTTLALDSLNGYLNSMPEERFLIVQMHELLSYLGQRGVATFLVLTQHGFLGSAMDAAVDVSYLADSVLLLRYYESKGAVKQALSVVKRRTGPHERTIRDMQITGKGIQIGEPLSYLRGVLTGIPQSEELTA